jgi:2-polyprenyl-3-methyl-5-hydroxy-6-metoxy-1,4-benzoquinol methylase
MLETDNVRDYFTRAAATFDSLYAEREMRSLERAINHRFRRDIYERFLLTMEHAQGYRLKSALDVGCGSGRYLVSLLEAGFDRLVGIDLSPTMIELARAHIDKLHGVTGTYELITGDFLEYQSDEVFDFVIAQGVFDYVNDPVTFLHRMRGMAKHSVVASFPSISMYRTPIRKLRYRIKRCPVYFYERPQISSFASAAGFSRCEIVKIKGAGQDYFVSFFV